VEHDPDAVADAHLVPEVVGDQVVERLVDRGLVRQDAYDPRLAQSPSADLRSSTRLVCSQVSSLSLRPKCPYAAVFL
jgi:hypothetical protein